MPPRTGPRPECATRPSRPPGTGGCGVDRVVHVAVVGEVDPHGVALRDEYRRAVLRVQGPRRRPAVGGEHVGPAVTGAVAHVLARHLSVEPGVPVLDRHEQLLIGRLVPPRIDPEHAAHPHVDVAVGLVVAVIEVGAGDVRRNPVGVFLAGHHGDARRRRDAVVLPRLADAVGVDPCHAQTRGNSTGPPIASPGWTGSDEVTARSVTWLPCSVTSTTSGLAACGSDADCWAAVAVPVPSAVSDGSVFVGAAQPASPNTPAVPVAFTNCRRERVGPGAPT